MKGPGLDETIDFNLSIINPTDGQKAMRGWSQTQGLRTILAALTNLLIFNVFSHIEMGMKVFGKPS